MSLDYDKIHRKEEDGHTNWWTSYADLFMMLSVVFLLMYVSASLRSGAAGYMKQLETEKIARENADLKEQIKVYTALKDQQLAQKNENEQQVYAKLMDKLKLLKEEAKEEKDNLMKQAKENEEKEFALNQYQQIVRNIIDANILAKAQISRRENIIISKEQTLKEKEKVITEQDREIRAKEDLIAKNEAEIAQVNSQLQRRVEQLRREQKAAHITRKEAEKRIALIKRETASKVEELRSKSEEAETQLKQVRGNLAVTEAKLGAAEQEKGQLSEQLTKNKQSYIAQIQRMRAESESKLAAERDEFQRNLKRQNLSAAARARKLKEFAEEAARKAEAMEGKIAVLDAKVRDTDAQLRDTDARLRATGEKLQGVEQEKTRYVAAVEGLKREKAAIQGDLERTRAMANARKEIAGSIGAAFKKAGIKANVDEKTGVVTLDFGEEYFDTGRAELKGHMKEKLNKFFPIYTDSLFNNPKSADKIANVEIIGFASSTFKGKYVNPNSLNPEDQEAVSYNLKLSFSRANEIFKHVYGKNALSDNQKKKLLPLIKVVGRGYLPEGKSANDIPSGMSEQKFCALYNCKKAQKVIVKFNLKD